VRKIAGEELDEEPKIPALNDFLDKKISFYKDYAKTLAKFQHPETETLNDLFKKTLKEVWGSSLI
jgi:hypothetical protein